MTRRKRPHRLTPKDARERRKQMTTMRRQGYTLAEIGPPEKLDDPPDHGQHIALPLDAVHRMALP